MSSKYGEVGGEDIHRRRTLTGTNLTHTHKFETCPHKACILLLACLDPHIQPLRRQAAIRAQGGL